MALFPNMPYDGFDDYDTAQIFRYWTGPVNFSGTGYAFFNTAAINPTAGRCGSGALQVSASGPVVPGCGPSLVFAPISTGFFSFAFSVSAFQERCNLIRLHYGGTDDAHNQIAIGINNDGTMFAVNAADHTTSATDLIGGVPLGTSATALNVNTFHQAVLDYTISPSAGIIKVYLDGSATPFLNLTSINTDPLGVGLVNSVQLGRVGAGGGTPATVITFDDFVPQDKTGSSPLNGNLGDVHVEMRLPPMNSVGAEQGWSATPGPNHSNMVNENPADDDTTYISAQTVGLTDTFPYLVLDQTGGTIYAVMIKPVARKDDAGYKELQGVARISSTDYLASLVGIPSLSSYLDFPFLFPLNPATSAPWAVADVNAAQFGVKVKT